MCPFSSLSGIAYLLYVRQSRDPECSGALTISCTYVRQSRDPESGGGPGRLSAMERLAALPCAGLAVSLTLLLPHLTAPLAALLALLLVCSLCLVAGLVLQVGTSTP